MNGPGGGSGKRTSSPGVPTPGEAAEALSAVRGAMRGGRRAAVGEITRVPLVVWGVIWCVDYAALEFLPGAVAVPLAAGLAAVAFGLSRRVGGKAQASSGWEAEVVGAWWVLLVGSVALALVVGPGSEVVLWLMLGAFLGDRPDAVRGGRQGPRVGRAGRGHRDSGGGVAGGLAAARTAALWSCLWSKHGGVGDGSLGEAFKPRSRQGS